MTMQSVAVKACACARTQCGGAACRAEDDASDAGRERRHRSVEVQRARRSFAHLCLVLLLNEEHAGCLVRVLRRKPMRERSQLSLMSLTLCQFASSQTRTSCP